MLTREGHVRVTDFGLSKENCTATNLMKTFGGTPQYMAPEIWKLENGQSEGYGFSVDWWAYGVMLYEVMICQQRENCNVTPGFDADDVRRESLRGRFSGGISTDGHNSGC